MSLENDLEKKRKVLALLRERKAVEQDSELLNFKPTLIQERFLLSPAKIRVSVGGNRTGKTEVCAVDTLIQTTGIVPAAIKDRYPTEYVRSGRYWVSSRSYGFSRDVAKPKIKRYLPKRLVDRFNKADFVYYLKDEAEIGFKSMDSGAIAYAGDSRLQIWMDEEHTKEVFKEAYMRTIDCNGRIALSFTPVEGLTWAYDDLYLKAKRYYYTKNKHGIKEEDGVVHTMEEMKLLKDREVFCRENTDPEADNNVEVFEMTIYDNPYLPDAEIINAERDNKHDPVHYQARILGVFAKVTGRQVYHIPMLMAGKKACPNKFLRGEIKSFTFKESVDGKFIMFKDKDPARQYIVAGDVAEGLEHGDYSCAQVLDHTTCEQVGIWWGKVAPEQFARILIEIGRYFNTAIVAPERQLHGFGVVNYIRDQRYPRLFCDDNPDLRVDAGSENKKYGWDTNARSKPIMVQDLGRFISEKHIKINDPNTWEELITYIYHNNGKTGALKGCHDDRAIALMIALQVFIKRRPYKPSAGGVHYQPIKPDKFTGY